MQAVWCGVKAVSELDKTLDVGLKPDSEICWLCDLDELLNHSEPPFPNL